MWLLPLLVNPTAEQPSNSLQLSHFQQLSHPGRSSLTFAIRCQSGSFWCGGAASGNSTVGFWGWAAGARFHNSTKRIIWCNRPSSQKCEWNSKTFSWPLVYNVWVRHWPVMIRHTWPLSRHPEVAPKGV